MQSNPLRRALAPALLASTLFTLPAAAQQRPFQAPEASADVKTAAEPALSGAAPATREVATRSALLPEAVPATPPAPARLPRAIDHTRVHWDAPGDGSLWARGEHYKMSFDASGATYYPLFGKAQERHVPLVLSPARATLGGAPLAFEERAPAVRDGDRVTIERGGFSEVYELTPASIEQLFVLESLPRAGELALEIPLATRGEAAADLVARETAEGFSFEHALGRVAYGRAVAVEADGTRSDAPTRLDGGAVTIRVAAELLQRAALPLVIDPVVSTFVIDNTGFNDYFSDCAYDAQTQRWLVVFEEYVTSSDSDIYYTMCNAAGVGMWGGYVNSNNASWESPRCANLYSVTQFLVVAGVEGSGSKTIRGRTVEADIFAIGNEFTISGSESGDKFLPAVGGDPYFAQPASYCVVWNREVDDFEDYDVHARLVNPDASLGALTYLSNSGGTSDLYPAISRSNGGSTWTIVWERTDDGSVWGGRIDYNGFVVNTPFQITAASNDQYAAVSSPLIGSQRTLVTYQRDYGSDFDIGVTLLDGASVVQHANLSLLEGGDTFLRDQRQASVDSDGHHFLVGYQERGGPSVAWDVLCTDLRLVGNTLEVAQGRLPLAVSGIFEGVVRVASAQGSSGPNRRYMATWHVAGAGGNDVHGALIDGDIGGAVSAFCLGDGSGVSCPCANNGAPGRGCGHSGNPAGALLSFSGTPSTWNDTALLTASGVPGATLCIFMQTSIAAPAAPFSDGIGCLTGETIRLASKNASMGSVSYPDLGQQLHHASGVPLDGGRRAYQVWYRNSPAFCTSAPSNISNGVIVDWAR